MTAGSFIRAGAVAVGVGRELIPREAIRLRKQSWIVERAHQFVNIVRHARSQQVEDNDGDEPTSTRATNA